MHKPLALVAALIGAPALAEDIPGTEFLFGLWRGAAQIDVTGAFTHCYATLSFAGGDQLWVNISQQDQVEVIFSFVKQAYRQGESFEASIMMESGLPTHGTAFGMGGHLVHFNMVPVPDAHAFLSQGNWLRLMGVGNDEAYDVRGLGGALGLVRTCADKQRG